ncbi:MAG TPA: PAS domain S-box protein [Puia sp.]|nr:PAS domain S-box protein [Puia sp.]
MKILVLEDSAYDAEEIIRRVQLSESFDCEFQVATDKDAYLAALEEFCPEIILSDHALPQFNSKEALSIARERFPDIPFIMVTGTVSEEYAIDMIKTGADDYILKDRMTRLPAAIMTSVQKRKAEKEKKRLEQALEFDRNNLTALINNTNDLVWSVDRDFKLIISNNAFNGMVSAMTGLTVEQGSVIQTDGFNPEQSSRFLEYYKRAFSGESFTVVEYADLHGGRWSELSFNPIYSGDSVSGATCFSRDITHRKLAEKEIADYKNAIDQASIVSITNERGAIKYVNENFCKISGYSAADLIGTDHRIFNSGYHSRDYMENLWTTIAEGKTWAGEIRNKARNGSLYWLDVTIIPFMDHQKKPVQYLTIGTDITKRKAMEQEIMNQKMQEQRKIARAIIKAQEKERNTLGQELHDNVNQILAATKLMLSSALEDPEKCHEMVLASQTNIVNAIEENRKIAQGLVVPDFETISLKEQLSSLTNAMLKTAGIYVITDISGFREEMLDDEQKLAIYRAAQEQYTNILKHAAAGFVYILLYTAEDYCKMLIFDNGKGQAAGTKTPGIGLRNIKGRLGLLNGMSRVEATPGKGFTLEIAIPLNNPVT